MNICIVGTGYVGLVTAACFAETGNTVTCVDVNPAVVEQLNAGQIHIFEPGLEDLVKRNRDEGRLVFTTEISEGLKGALFVFVCVGTPPREDGRADLSHVYTVAADIGRLIGDFTVVVNKSTVPVGTADAVHGIIRAELNRRGVDVAFDVVSNPEFLKEGDAVNDFMKPDRIIVGTDNTRATDLLRALYTPYARSREKLIVMSVRSAETTKYAANCLLATKISFINEIANICERVGANVMEVRHGIGADQRIGYHFIYPGVGFGGSCFPKDIKALIQTAREFGYAPELLEAVDHVNHRQKQSLPQTIIRHFANLGGVEGRTLALWGISFKPNTDDTRESPAYELIRTLTGLGIAHSGLRPGRRPARRPGTCRQSPAHNCRPPI